MEIVSFIAIKGGVGKTTLCYNYGEWLANTGKNVLFIDSDHQCSLTQTYNIYRDSGTLADIFISQQTPEIINIHENLSIIPASMNLDTVNNEIQTKVNKELLMYMWLFDNYESLKHFDYILIDCHPDFSTITQNMIAISDTLFSPIEPSEYGFTAKDNLEIRLEQLRNDVINVQTRKSFITAKLKYIGNRIKHNTSSSRAFVTAMGTDKHTIAMIPEREIFNKTTLNHQPLIKMNRSELIKANQKIYDEINEIFKKMSDI